MTDSRSPAPQRVLETVPSTKLQPPRQARHLIARDALIARLVDARRLRCVMVQGPAGSGKTSTLVAWRQALLTLDFDVAWLSLVSEDDEPEHFFACLLASLAQIDEGIVEEAAQLLGREDDAADDEHWVITLVQGLTRHGRELVLVLDDLQHLQHQRILRALQWLLEYAPPNLHLGLGTRGAPPPPLTLPLTFPLSRLRTQGQLAEFDLRDLRFSAEESGRFLREQLGSISHRDAQALHELTDGWVAGLQLFAIDLKAKHGAGYAPVQVRDAIAFGHYFEHEVLAHLPADDLDLLMHCAVCNRFSASLCATMLGRPNAVARMTTRLAHLDRENLFVSQITSPDHETWYRIHPLLRELLLQRLAAQPGVDLRALHATAWRWFNAHGHVDEALRHAVEADEADAAADLLDGCADDLMERGAIVQLGNLARRLPPAQVRKHFRLRRAMAHLLLYGRKLDALEVELREMDAMTLDARQRYGLLVLRAAAAMQRDDSDTVHAMQAAMEASPADIDAFSVAGRCHVLGWMLASRGEYDAAHRRLEQSERAGISPYRRFLGRAMEGLCLTLEGRTAEAEPVLGELLRESEAMVPPDLAGATMAAALLADPLYETNQLSAALELLAPRIEMIEHMATPDGVLSALLVLASAHWVLGNRLEAMTQIERLEDHAARHGLDRLMVQALSLRMRWHLKEVQIDKAEAVLQRIRTLGQRHAGAQRGTHAAIPRIAARAQALMSLHWNDFGAAVDRLEPVLAQASAAGRWREVATERMLLALAESQRGHAEAAREHLIESLRLGHRLGLVRSLLDVGPRIPALLKHLQADKVLDPVLDFYVQRLLAASTRTRSAAAAASGEAGDKVADKSGETALENFSDREREVLNLVAQAMPNKKIARVLGVTPHTVKWHLRRIYQKLGVTERDQAAARLRDLESGGATKAS